MTLMSSDLQSDSNLDSNRNSCDVLICFSQPIWIGLYYKLQILQISQRKKRNKQTDKRNDYNMTKRFLDVVVIQCRPICLVNKWQEKSEGSPWSGEAPDFHNIVPPTLSHCHPHCHPGPTGVISLLYMVHLPNRFCIIYPSFFFIFGAF